LASEGGTDVTAEWFGSDECRFESYRTRHITRDLQVSIFHVQSVVQAADCLVVNLTGTDAAGG
jgi:hypothetical protein